MALTPKHGDDQSAAIGPRPIHSVAQQVNFPSLVDDNAPCRDRQPVAPFAGEHLCTAVKLLGQSQTA